MMNNPVRRLMDCEACLESLATTGKGANTDKQTKARAKKWRKQESKGSVNTCASLLQCKTYGVRVSPRLQWEGSVSERPVRELQGFLLSVLRAMLPTGSSSSVGGGDDGGDASGNECITAPIATPTWVNVGNRAAVRQLRLILVSNAPHSMFPRNGQPPTWQPHASGFFAECGGAVPLRLSDRKSHPIELLDALLVVRKAGGGVSGRGGKAKKRKRFDGSSGRMSSSSGAAATPSEGRGEARLEAGAGAVAGKGQEPMTAAKIYERAQEYVLSVDKQRLLGYPVPDSLGLGDSLGSLQPTSVYSPEGYARRPRSASEAASTAMRAAGAAGLMFDEDGDGDENEIDDGSDEEERDVRGQITAIDDNAQGGGDGGDGGDGSDSGLNGHAPAENGDQRPGMGSLSSGHDEIVTINAANAVLDELAEEVRTDELPAATDSGASSSLSSSSSSSSSFPYLSSSSPSSTHPSLLSLPAVEESARVLEALEAPRGLATGFVQTLPTAHRRCCQTLVALDCEMVLTTIGRLELARISVVDERGRVLLDEFVKPHNAVKDYQTRFSGVTEEILRGVDTSLEQVQCALLGMIDASTVVVGHSLENDLMALKLTHGCCVDTAIAYTSHRGPAYKPALRHLTTEFLQRSIQCYGRDGHSSVEDARASLELALLKFRHGRAFGCAGVGVSGNDGSGDFGVLDAVAPHLRCAVVGQEEKLRCLGAGLCSMHAVIENRSERIVPRLVDLDSKQQNSWKSARRKRTAACDGNGGAGADQEEEEEEEEEGEEDDEEGDWRVIVALIDCEKLSLSSSSSSSSSSSGSPSSGALTSSSSSLGDRLQDQVDALRANAPSDTLTVLLLQPPLGPAGEMVRQRRACAYARSSCVWTAKQEKRLVAEVALSQQSLAFVHLARKED